MNSTKVFEDSVKGSNRYKEILGIVKRNTEGKIWIIGGFVYRNIAHKLYGAPKPKCDVDFVVEKVKTKIKLPKGWRFTKNKFGNPKFTKKSTDIDLSLLDKSHYITRKKLKPTIRNYLKGVPFTIQSIAYDVYGKKVIGETGIKALSKKTISINDPEQASYTLPIQGRLAEDWLKRLAKELDFKIK